MNVLLFVSVSTNELVFRKCNTDHCKPLRSPLRQIIGDGFLPPPVAISRKFVDGQPVITLADPSEVSPQDRLISPFKAKALGLDLNSVPTDMYCPTAKGHLRDRTCPVCKQYFPSISQMLVHRRALHKYTRSKLDDAYEQGIDAEGEPVRILSTIRESFYSVLFASGTSSTLL